MNVGQVEFSVTSKTLESVLASARELQTILNGIDGKSYGGKGGGGIKKTKDALRDYHNRIRRWYANDQKKVAIQERERQQKAEKQEAKHLDKIAKMNIKSGNLKVKERLKTDKRIARLDRDEAARQDAIARANIKRGNLKINERFKTAKRMQKLEKEETKRQQDELKAQQDAFLQQTKERASWQRGMQRQIVNIGAQAQTLGATLQRVTSPFADVYRGLMYGVGYRILGKVTESISGAFSRYDTISTYAKVLNNLGIDATKKFSVAGEEATDVYHNLENAVLGLPTGIDEIIESMRRYAGATGEAERATKLAIAANNAYIAGGMGEREKLFTERQLRGLAAGKQLTPNQWDSLSRNAPLMMKSVAKAMKMSTKEMDEALKSGTISGEKFLDVLIKIGTEGSLKNAAQVMKSTWDAVSQNVQNRLNAMGEGILKTLDKVFEATDGRSFLQHVLGFDKNNNYIQGKGIRGVIDDLAKSARQWIRSNPDKILKFLDNIKTIDWKGIVGGFADMGLKLGTFYSGAAKIFGHKGFIEFMVGLNMTGKAIQTGGGLIKGTAWLSSWLLTLAKFGKLGKMAAAIKGTETAGKAAYNITRNGKALKTAAQTTADLTSSWQRVAMHGLNIVAIGVVAASIKMIASAFVDIGKANVDPGKLTQFAIGAAAFIGEFAGIAQLLGAKGVFTGIAQFSRFFGEAEIALIAHDISVVAKALGDVSNVEVPDKTKLKRVMKAVSDFADVLPSTDVFSAIGKFFSSKTVSSTAKAVSNVTSAINSVNSIKGNLKKFRKVMFGDMNPHANGKGGGSWGDDNSIVGIMQDMLTEFDKNKILDTFAESVKSGNIAKVFGALASMMTDFTTIANTKLNEKQIEKATTNIDTLSSSIQPLLSSFSKLYGMEFGTTSGYGKTQAERKGASAANKSISSTYGAQAQGFAKMMEQLDKTLEFVSGIITKFNKMKNKLDKLNQNYGDNFGVLSFAPIGGVISAITGMFDAAGVATSDYSMAPDNMGYIDEAMGTLEGVVDKMNTVKSKIEEVSEGGSTFSEIGSQIEKVLIDLNSALTHVPQLESGASMLSAAFGVLKGAMNKLSNISGDYTAQVANIKSAISQLQAIGSQTIMISLIIDGTVTNKIPDAITVAATAIINALKLILPKYEKTSDVEIKLGQHTDTVSPYIIAVANRIRRAFNSIPSTLNKTVTMNITKRRNEVSQFSTGGKVGHKVQYRAHGGSIFQPKGTDTIPAMLTEGEFVVNHMASNAIGYDVLQKLNHLDIAGAIRGLYAKVSAGTINNTKNANVTVNNYNAPSVGFAKASRWVAQL